MALTDSDIKKFIKTHLPKTPSEHILSLFRDRRYVVGRIAFSLVKEAYDQGHRDGYESRKAGY
jgi:hypothetical protein